METIERSVEVLNDLIEINNDRAAGFERAAKQLDSGDSDLRTLFESSARESRQNVKELTAAVNKLGREAETGTSGTGALHRAWINVKATFSGHDRKSILAECERGEDAIKGTYGDALSENDLPPEIISIIWRQQQVIEASHDTIKRLRDSQS
ncbi:MAG: hypothetical protein JWP78_3505 [Mucilaginibacter sp.]|jgi:uncharacterized protein (TIGR02284 family)|nr:hypothetical protein [Mucilaginibacter sp.]